MKGTAVKKPVTKAKKTRKTTKKVFVSLILDESGSMSSCLDATYF